MIPLNIIRSTYVKVPSKWVRSWLLARPLVDPLEQRPDRGLAHPPS